MSAVVTECSSTLVATFVVLVALMMAIGTTTGARLLGLLRSLKQSTGKDAGAPDEPVMPRMPSSIALGQSSYAINPMSVLDERVVIAMVGLPARGKSYMSKAVVKYLNFLGCPVRLFNAGDKRRVAGLAGTDASFFDASNATAARHREQIAMDTLDELLAWLASMPRGCACGIFDATNTTVARRRAVIERCAHAEKARCTALRLVFVESVCSDESILRHSYTLKLGNADYQGADPAKAHGDFVARVGEYEKVYETITDAEVHGFEAEFDTNGGRLRYLQTHDAGRKVVTSGCSGLLMSQVATLLQSIHLFPRKLSILIAGESENDHLGIRGGDTELSLEGLRYSTALCKLVWSREQVAAGHRQVLTGTLRRYSQLTHLLLRDPGWQKSSCLQLKELNELCFGSLEGLPGGQLRHAHPHEFEKRKANKLHYRYPGVGGESYMDRVMQARELIIWLERAQADVAVVCDVTVARVLLGYFEGIATDRIPEIQVAPGLIELTRSHSGFSRVELRVDEGAVHCGDSLLAEAMYNDWSGQQDIAAGLRA